MKLKNIIIILILFLLTACDKPKTDNNPLEQEKQPESAKSAISENICSYFSQDFVANAIGKPITKIESQSGGGSYNCQYYVDDNHFVSLTLNYLSVESQKKGAQALDRKIDTSEMIKIEHFLTIQDDGNTNAIYLVLGPNQFIRVDRSSGKAIDNQTLLNLAVAVSKKL